MAIFNLVVGNRATCRWPRGLLSWRLYGHRHRRRAESAVSLRTGCLIISIVVGAIAAAILGLIGISPARLSGDYLAIVTLAFSGEIVKEIVTCLIQQVSTPAACT